MSANASELGETELLQMVSEKDGYNSSEKRDSLISGLMTELESKTKQSEDVFTEFQNLKAESEEDPVESSQK